MITARHESWPLARPFTISRGSKTSAEVVVASVEHEGESGHGECVPYRHYGESIESVIEQIEKAATALSPRPDRKLLQSLLPPGAARNALDCAMWDLEAKQARQRVWHIANVDMPAHMVCAYTLSLSGVEAMRAAATESAGLPLLKMKVGREEAIERISAVREGAPDTKLIVDANEAWTLDLLATLMPELKALNVSLLEQPLPADHDEGLGGIEHLVPIAADESCHTSADVERLCGLYDVVNIKLDKTGGLTEAIKLAECALQNGLRIMVGCMVGTSLAMAPAMLIGSSAEFVDLDGPLLLARDREHGLTYSRGQVARPSVELWG